MRVLHVFNQDLNPYVSVVQEGLRAAGVAVESGTMPFWEGWGGAYDVVHVQWPETLFDWRAPTEIELVLLGERLAALKGRVPVVMTHHNERSNHCTPENAERLDRLYAMVREAADAVVHLGAVTVPEEADGRVHAVIPIPVYEKLYAPYLGVGREEARRRLGLPAGRRVLLCFGNFRSDAERGLVEAGLAAVRGAAAGRGVCVDAPKWFNPRDLGFSVLQPVFLLRSAGRVLRAKGRGIRAGAVKLMDDERVALHFAACDAVWLQRTRQLNSGNLPMAYLFGKVAAGPDWGNIGGWLRATGNPVFDPGDAGSVGEALEEALRRGGEGLGERNRAFALAEWNTDRVGAEHARLYRRLAG